jgi:hypothetical protein
MQPQGNFPQQNNQFQPNPGVNYPRPLPRPARNINQSPAHVYAPYSNQQFNQPPAQSVQGFTGPGQPNDFQFQQPVQKKKSNFSNFLSKKYIIIAIISSLVAVAALAGFWFFTQPRQTTAEKVYRNVSASILAPKNLAQGSPSEWEITIENKEPVAIANIQVELRFDKDFQYLKELSPKPDNTEGTKYTIARLDETGGRSSVAKIRFEGLLIGNPDIETEMLGTYSYQAEISPGKLGKVTTANIDVTRTKITSPQIDLTLVPTLDEVQNNGEAEFTAKITNRTDQEFRDLRVRMVYPSGQNSFTYTNSEYSSGNTAAPKTTPDNGDNIWDVSRLAGGAENILKVRGRVIGASQAQLTFGVEISIKNQSGEYRVIRQTFKDIRILAQPIKISTKIDGKDNSKVIIAGETLSVTVNYENDSQQTLNNVQITTFINDPANLLDLSSITFKGGERGDIIGNQITWQATRVPQLGSLRPAQKGTLNYSIKVKDATGFLNTNIDQTQYTIRPGVQIKAQNLEQIEVTGDLYKGQGKVEFFQDTPVLKETNPTTNKNVYSFTWRLRSWQNEVTEVAIKTVSPLPPGSWLDKVTPEANKSSLVYSDVNGEIVWNVGKLESYTGRSAPEISITFEMEIDRGGQTVLQKPTLTGTDVFTGEKIEISGTETRITR